MKYTMRRIVLCVTFLSPLIASGCSGESDPITHKPIMPNQDDKVSGYVDIQYEEHPKTDPQEHIIMNAIVEEIVVKRENTINQKRKQLTLYPLTLSNPNKTEASEWEYLYACSPTLEYGTYKNFISRNGSTHLINDELLQAPKGVCTLPKAEMELLRVAIKDKEETSLGAIDQIVLESRPWIRLSRPGINAEGNQAMIAVAVSGGEMPLNGWMGIYLLEKSVESWRVLGPIGSELVQ